MATNVSAWATLGGKGMSAHAELSDVFGSVQFIYHNTKKSKGGLLFLQILFDFFILYEFVLNCMKKETKEKKFTIRISQEFHDMLKELKDEYGTMENGLKKIYEQWKERRKK